MEFEYELIFFCLHRNSRVNDGLCPKMFVHLLLRDHAMIGNVQFKVFQHNFSVEIAHFCDFFAINSILSILLRLTAKLTLLFIFQFFLQF